MVIQNSDCNSQKVTEEDLLKRTLPDYLSPNLDVVFISLNPNLTSVQNGKYYEGPNDHFWECMHLAGILPEMTSSDDSRLKEFGVGLTKIVATTTKDVSDLSESQVTEGVSSLREKLIQHRPKIAVFEGKDIFKVFTGFKDFNMGLQPGHLDGSLDIRMFVLSDSPRLTTKEQKLPYYVALKKCIDHVRGTLSQLSIEEVSFPRNRKRKSAQAQAIREKSPEAEKFEEIGFFGFGC